MANGISNGYPTQVAPADLDREYIEEWRKEWGPVLQSKSVMLGLLTTYNGCPVFPPIKEIPPDWRSITVQVANKEGRALLYTLIKEGNEWVRLNGKYPEREYMGKVYVFPPETS